jgi:hypothetical protein
LIDCIEHCDDEGVAAVLRSAPALEQVDLLAHQIEAYNWARISGI